MSQLNRTDLNDKYNNTGTGRFRPGQVRGIGSDDYREFMDDFRDSLFNLMDHQFSGAGGTKNNLNVISALKSLVTTDKLTGIQVAFRDTSNGDVLRFYELVSGTDVEASPSIIRPSDYATSTNERVWKLAHSFSYESMAVSSSGTDTYTATPAPAITAYAVNQKFYIKFGNANTGPATLNLAGLGAKAIKKSGTLALVAGDISANQIVLLIYDGTNFQVVGGGGGASLVDPLVFKGAIDCSANPNYPAADAGEVYKISVAGKIGGASGPVVEAGDTALCTVDGTASGNHATVGANWVIWQNNIDRATTAEINAGSDGLKLITPAAIEGSKYLDQSGGKQYAATSGTNTYTATIAPAIAAYATGQVFRLKFGNSNTGAATINLNGLGAKSIVKEVSTALVSGDIAANQILTVFYDGTNFVILSKTNYSTFAELIIAGQSGTGYRFTILDSSGKVVRAGELEYNPTTGEILFNGIDDLAATYIVTIKNDSGAVVARFSAGKFMELGGTEFIIQVDSSISSGNARMILNDNQAMGLITEDSTGKEYTSYRTTDNDERFNIRVKRRLDTIAGNDAPMDEFQFQATTSSTNSAVNLIGSIPMSTDEEVVKFEVEFFAITNAGVGGWQKIKGAVQRISGGTVQAFGTNVSDTIRRTAGTFLFSVDPDNTNKRINLNFTNNTSGGLVFKVTANAKWTRTLEPA